MCSNCNGNEYREAIEADARARRKVPLSEGEEGINGERGGGKVVPPQSPDTEAA